MYRYTEFICLKPVYFCIYFCVYTYTAILLYRDVLKLNKEIDFMLISHRCEIETN